MTTIHVITFIAGFALGLATALLTIIWRDNRRFSKKNEAEARRDLTEWRKNNPDIVEAWRKADAEPTELDQ